MLTMPSGLELRKVLEQLNRGLAALAAEAERHTCLVLRMLRVREECGAAADASAADRAARGRCRNGHLNMRLVSWLTKLEKADSPVSTRVFRLVAVLD